jgi:hypothetical protein
MDIDQKNHTARAAIGERGFLIRTFDDRVLFRVYDHEHNFVDYEITNHDCEVVIIDPSAALIRNDAGDFLDYTAEALGIEKN